MGKINVVELCATKPFKSSKPDPLDSFDDLNMMSRTPILGGLEVPLRPSTPGYFSSSNSGSPEERRDRRFLCITSLFNAKILLID
jgi:hypothetical protein